MLPIKNREHNFFTISAKRVLLWKRAGKERLNREGAKRCEEHEGVDQPVIIKKSPPKKGIENPPSCSLCALWLVFYPTKLYTLLL